MAAQRGAERVRIDFDRASAIEIGPAQGAPPPPPPPPPAAGPDAQRSTLGQLETAEVEPAEGARPPPPSRARPGEAAASVRFSFL